MKSTILITGANRGIGKGLCSQFLQMGYRVVAASRDPSSLDELQTHENVISEALDIASTESIENLAARLKQNNIKLDILINNAGITLDEKFGEWSQNAFMRSLSVNAIGPAILVQSLREQLNDQARVIQMSSGLGSLSNNGQSLDPYCSYSMSKVALNMLTVKLSAELKHKNAIVVSLNPGWVQTDMGGHEAPDTVKEAVIKLSSVIKGLTPKDSGRFLSANAEEIPW